MRQTSAGIVGNSENDVAGGVSEEDAKAYARKSFDKISSICLSPYVHRRGVLDAE
jgi:hypothetical protein